MCSVEFDRKDILSNKLVVTTLESQFHVYDLRTQHPKKGFASLCEKVSLQPPLARRVVVVCVCVCMHVCVCVCACMCACVCVHVCVRAYRHACVRGCMCWCSYQYGTSSAHSTWMTTWVKYHTP